MKELLGLNQIVSILRIFSNNKDARIEQRFATMRFSLKSCVWKTTLACCFSCKYCGSSGEKAWLGEFTTSECLTVIDQFTDVRSKRAFLLLAEGF